MEATCGTCTKFNRCREGGLVGWCTAGPCKKGGVRPMVSASMRAEGCPDYKMADQRLALRRGLVRFAEKKGDGMADNLERLSDALFEELERLGAVDLKDTEKVEAELNRARAVCSVASQITANHNTAISVLRMQVDAGTGKGSGAARLLGA